MYVLSYWPFGAVCAIPAAIDDGLLLAVPYLFLILLDFCLDSTTTSNTSTGTYLPTSFGKNGTRPSPDKLAEI